MTGRVIPLGRIAGIPIRLDSSWFLIFALVTWTLAPALELPRYLAYINLMLGLFNLIPGFPLDGARVFRGVVWGVTRDADRATRVAGTVGRIIGYLFVLFGVWQILGGNFINGLWISFIGWFLENAAMSEMQGQAILEILTGHKVREAMRPDYISVPADRTLQQLVAGHVLVHGHGAFLGERDGRVLGLLTLRGIPRHPAPPCPTVRAEDVMIPKTEMQTTRRDSALRDVLEHLDRAGVNQLPVIANS